jgi:hypothetical protein
VTTLTLAVVLGSGGAALADETAEPAPPVYDQAVCDAATNHGAYVAYVARATKGQPDRAALVKAAARSDCGKAKAAKAKPAKSKPAHEDRRADRKAVRKGNGRSGR